MYNFGMASIALLFIALVAICVMINPMAALIALGPILFVILLAAFFSNVHTYVKEDEMGDSIV